MIYFTALGFALGLTAGFLLWYGYKERADFLSKHAETLQWCLDRCAERCVELDIPLPTSKPIDGKSPFVHNSEESE